jgi:hypothetical protein
MQEDSDLVWKFFNASCTSYALWNDDPAQKWCMVDDTYRPIYVDRSTGKLYDQPPSGITFESTQRRAALFQDEDQEKYAELYFRLYYREEATGKIVSEYIEPLVGLLRNPVTCCEHLYTPGIEFREPLPTPMKCRGSNLLMTFRGQFVPPPSLVPVDHTGTSGGVRPKTFFFDAGASDWVDGAGGPSLSYFDTIWKRTTDDQQPFIPQEIMRKTTKEDYVLFKVSSYTYSCF